MRRRPQRRPPSRPRLQNPLHARVPPRAADTEQLGKLDKFFDRSALASMCEDGTMDAWAPKGVYLRGEVTEHDLREYNGWAKIGVVLLTMEDDLDKINARLDTCVRRLFYNSERGFLPCEVIDEDGPGDTHLRPSILHERASEQK